MYIGRLRGSQGVEDSVLFECGSFKNVFIIILWGHQGCVASVLLTKLSHWPKGLIFIFYFYFLPTLACLCKIMKHVLA